MSIRVRELLPPAQQLQAAVVSNYMVDLPWLLSEAPSLLAAKEIIILHGEGKSDMGPSMHRMLERIGNGVKVLYSILCSFFGTLQRMLERVGNGVGLLFLVCIIIGWCYS